MILEKGWRKQIAPGRELRMRALKLIRESGVPYSIRRNRCWYNGKIIAAGPRIETENVLHEAAHWIVASRAKRKVVNYGLGMDPAGDTPHWIESPELEDDADKEVIASGLGILFVAWIGGRADLVFHDHSWIENEAERVMEGVRKLKLAVSVAARHGVHVPKDVLLASVKVLRVECEKYIRRTKNLPEETSA